MWSATSSKRCAHTNDQCQSPYLRLPDRAPQAGKCQINTKARILKNFLFELEHSFDFWISKFGLNPNLEFLQNIFVVNLLQFLFMGRFFLGEDQKQLFQLWFGDELGSRLIETLGLLLILDGHP